MFFTHQVIRFASSDNADVNALSSSFFEYVIVPAVSNDLLFPSHFCVRCEVAYESKTGHFPVNVSQEMWQTQAAHQSNKNYECDDYTPEIENDYIFVFCH